MATAGSRRGGLVQGVRIDLRRLYDTWMELVYPRQRSAHDVLGRWTPNTTSGWIAYRLWGAIGVLIVSVLYPLTLVGVVLRFYSRRIDTMIAGLGILGVMIVAAIAWGALTVVAHFQLSWNGFLAVAAAGTVATFSAGIAALATKVDGRPTTVGVAYPAAMTAIFLPPVVAAMFSPTAHAAVFDPTWNLAVWILDTILWVGDLNTWLRESFTLNRRTMVPMWLGISVPLGWFLGILVTLADVVRPKNED